MGFVAKAFGFGSSTPQVAPAPPSPSLADKAAQDAAEEERRRRAGKGRASTVLAGARGLSEEDKPGAQTLLGAGN